MSRSYRKIIRNRKRRIERRLDPKKAWSNQPKPMMTASNIHYEMSEKTRAINCGGIGAIHTMVNKIGLREEIDSRVHLLKRHLPYHESDHVLNLAYNAMLDGVRLQDIELRRNDEGFLDGLGAQRIPDPTTSGDFTRRFSESDIVTLMDAINATRQRVWRQQGSEFLSEAFIDVDGTITGTGGECKGGMSLSYKGIWGYAPLVVSLANTNEVLYLVNRPGNVTSHDGCVTWIDRAIEVVAPHAGQITLRGDTDFTVTGELDRWHKNGHQFIFGMDAHPKVVGLAEALAEQVWKPLERLPRYEITNRRKDAAEKIVGLANGRCNQENVIEQLKNGVNAMRMPVNDLLSNWAYMVMTALAWNLKAWFALLLPEVKRGEEILKMEFRRFLHCLILIPAQIVRAGRRIIYRLLCYNSWVPDLFRAWESLRRLQVA